MGAAGSVGPAGVILQLAIAQSGARLWGQRGGSSTSPTAEREPRGSSAKVGEGATRSALRFRRWSRAERVRHHP